MPDPVTAPMVESKSFCGAVFSLNSSLRSIFTAAISTSLAMVTSVISVGISVTNGVTSMFSIVESVSSVESSNVSIGSSWNSSISSGASSKAAKMTRFNNLSGAGTIKSAKTRIPTAWITILTIQLGTALKMTKRLRRSNPLPACSSSSPAPTSDKGRSLGELSVLAAGATGSVATGLTSDAS